MSVPAAVRPARGREDEEGTDDRHRPRDARRAGHRAAARRGDRRSVPLAGGRHERRDASLDRGAERLYRRRARRVARPGGPARAAGRAAAGRLRAVGGQVPQSCLFRQARGAAEPANPLRSGWPGGGCADPARPERAEQGRHGGARLVVPLAGRRARGLRHLGVRRRAQHAAHQGRGRGRGRSGAHPGHPVLLGRLGARRGLVLLHATAGARQRPRRRGGLQPARPLPPCRRRSRAGPDRLRRGASVRGTVRGRCLAERPVAAGDGVHGLDQVRSVPQGSAGRAWR